MDMKILTVYKSVTGFTMQYAKWIGEELDCTVADLKNVSEKTMSEYDTVIFGGRLHAGNVDGLKRAKKLFAESGARRLIVFAVGALPCSASELIEETWRNNLTPDESESIPHFYMEGGLCYERLPLGDRMMTKVFAAMLKNKKDKSEYEQTISQALTGAYDNSSRKNINPLVSYVKNGEQLT